MPRLTPSLLRHANVLDPNLALLLPACRDITSAKLELRWLREHAIRIVNGTFTSSAHNNIAKKRTTTKKDTIAGPEEQLLSRLVRERATGKPLQYVIGTEFFGDLEIQCREGVLIPRPDTAGWVSRVAKRLILAHEAGRRLPSKLRVLDLCTGTGCIPLLFQHLVSQYNKDPLEKPQISALGVDISAKAIKLADLNKKLLSSFLTSTEDSRIAAIPKPESLRSPKLSFIQADIFSSNLSCQLSTFQMMPVDILFSNPPYISQTGFFHGTAGSVRKFEPITALVPQSSISSLPDAPDKSGDVFYPQLLGISKAVGAKIIAFEVADMNQALRVANLATGQNIWDVIEIWRDDYNESSIECMVRKNADGIYICGAGEGRTVVCLREEGIKWLHHNRHLHTSS